MVLSVLILIAYFVVWALVHSLLASLRFKDWTRRLLGPGTDQWYRLAYVVFAGITVLPMLAMVALLPNRTLYVIPAPWRWLMVGGQVSALVALVGAVLQTGPSYFLGLSQLLAKQTDQEDSLEVRGFYCWVRHPLYLLSIVFLWLTPAMTVNLATLYALITLYFAIGSLHEENRLLVQFGAAYRDYQRQVSWFIPRPDRCYASPKERVASD